MRTEPASTRWWVTINDNWAEAVTAANAANAATVAVTLFLMPGRERRESIDKMTVARTKVGKGRLTKRRAG